MATATADMNSFQNTNLNIESSETDPRSPRRHFVVFSPPVSEVEKRRGRVWEAMLGSQQAACPSNRGVAVLRAMALW